ncbi:MAG: hypothetical protein M1827_002012 [Pycnora praestabilis]|nr:MAG: hypothetical protein M1827_002012 [Pycnora praestabilis]
MRLPPSSSGLEARQDTPPKQNSGALIGTIAGILAAVLIAIVLFFTLRSLRQKHPNPRYIPTAFLKRKWRGWSSKGNYFRASDGGSAHNGETSLDNTSTSYSNAGEPQPAAAGGVDRNTSVRSVMTLPAYNPNPRPNEKILGREGERAGIDTVIEYPEDAEEEESRREEEMESLYQIRVARRTEAAEREERRRLRREAREREDWAALEELRIRSRLRADSSGTQNAPGASTTILGSSNLINDHTARDRERRISSVSYMDVGLARHDGTRVRANSEDSSEWPLLETAASMGGTVSRPASLFTPSHRRDRSASSALSISTNASDDHDHTTPSTRNGHGSSYFERSSLSNVQTPSASQDTPSGSSDLGEAHIPPPEPPQYENLGWEEAPPYESPVRTRAPQLPALVTLPAIEVTGTTPINSVPATPVNLQRRDSEGQQAPR